MDLELLTLVMGPFEDLVTSHEQCDNAFHAMFCCALINVTHSLDGSLLVHAS